MLTPNGLWFSSAAPLDRESTWTDFHLSRWCLGVVPFFKYGAQTSKESFDPLPSGQQYP
jgi:hypothetical protein